MKPTLVVLAAGMGSRYGGLKQIDPVGPAGETIIDYSVYDAAKSGFSKVVFIIRQDIEKDFREFVGNKYDDCIDVEMAFQEIDKLPKGIQKPKDRIKPWGTGHAILCARECVTENFLVINGDDFYGRASFELAGDYLSKAKDDGRADYLMVAYELQKTLSEHGHVSRGICELSSEGQLLDIVERTKIEKENGSIIHREENGETIQFQGMEETSMNMFGFTPSIFDHLKEKFDVFLQNQMKDNKSEFYIPTAVGELIKEKKANVQVLRTDERWFGVTYREDKESVKQNIKALIKEGRYPEKLF